MQQPFEPDISNHRGPGRRAVDLISGAVRVAVMLAMLLFVADVLNPFSWRHRRSPLAKRMATETQMLSFQQALLAYTRDYGRPPTTKQGLAALVVPPIPPQPRPWHRYVDAPEIPKDPWGNDYHYASPGRRGERWILRNFGKDGVPGGKGDAADLVLQYEDAVRDVQLGP